MKTHIRKRFIGYTITSQVKVPVGWIGITAWGLTVGAAKRKLDRVAGKVMSF